METAFGDVRVRFARARGHEFFFLMRHGEGHAVPPHRVAYRANAAALRAARVDRVIGVASVGSLRADVAPGAFVVPDDFVDFSDRTERSFFDEDVVHVDVSEAYCPVVRRALVAGARAAGALVVDGGVYVATPGPRFETRAEARFLASLGHVVGMTGCPEAALMRELGLCYASLSVVANFAAGVGDRAYLTRDIVQAARALEDRVRDALAFAVDALDPAAACACASALEGALIHDARALTRRGGP